MNKKSANIDLSSITIEEANRENLYEIKICAHEFLDFINDFKERFLEKNLIVFTVNYKKLLVGVIVAEDKSYKVNSLERMLPIMYIHLIYINPSFREKGIGNLLLDHFLQTEKDKGIASVFAKIPKKYVKGIKFYLRNDFHVISRKKNKIILKKELWNNFGLKKCFLIGTSLNDIFT